MKRKRTIIEKNIPIDEKIYNYTQILEGVKDVYLTIVFQGKFIPVLKLFKSINDPRIDYYCESEIEKIIRKE